MELRSNHPTITWLQSPSWKYCVDKNCDDVAADDGGGVGDCGDDDDDNDDDKASEGLPHGLHAPADGGWWGK